MSVSHCRSCGAPIEWAFTLQRRSIPLDIEIGPGNLVLDHSGVVRVVP